MTRTMRQDTLETLGLGTALEIFKNARLPASPAELVDRVFGPASDRGALLISGANGIVGAGKAMQLGSRLEPFGVPVVALDFPNAPDGLGRQYPGLERAFGRERAAKIMSGVVRFAYDGANLPPQIKAFKPRFALEAIPEILDIKKKHYEVLRSSYEGIEIFSVTSGFPSSELGVGIAHPAFPHEINKVWEIIEPAASDVTRMLWALGMIPMPVKDNWSFVLDVLFCGLTLASSRYHEASNMPFWKIDKYVRRLLGPNPFRAHDAIGAKGANFLTWSCLHHLSQHYGALFAPTRVLEEHRISGNWYPPNHFRPLVDWTLDDEEHGLFRTWLLGPMIQMASLMLHEQRSHLSFMNSIGEICAQFAKGIPALVRRLGPEEAVRIVEAYHRLHPEAAAGAWHPEAFALLDTVECKQLYVNAEHDGKVGVITLGREAYNQDVDDELNRAIDWLKGDGIENVILSGDFHLSTQLVGADTQEFYPALEDAAKGVDIARSWSETARRLHTEFATSVGFVNGKRCLGGMLELFTHCHYLVAVEDAQLGMPEVTLPVVPGMEGCHWPLRKTGSENWPKVLSLLLTGRSVSAREAVGWLVDHAGPLEDALATAYKIASGADRGLPRRPVVAEPLANVTVKLPPLGGPAGAEIEAARKAILENVRASTSATLADALAIQARNSGEFMVSKECLRGVIGTMFKKTMKI